MLKKYTGGGSGYAITLEHGREIYYKELDPVLPKEIEHQYPDYELYGITDVAYGFLTRGCPRGCDFCHVKSKEGQCSRKVSDLSEFWNGQKDIVLLDPNIFACHEWKGLLKQLADSKARIDFSQGLDIRMMTNEKADALKQIKLSGKGLHFAWDRIEDREIIQPKFKEFRARSTIGSHQLQVYVLTGDRSHELTESDEYRVQWLKENGYAPYVMIYDKEHASKELRRFQRYVNNRFVFWKTEWKDYMKNEDTNDFDRVEG